MNKISKKIVALVTMAAFILTLAPVAAFAVTGVVEPDNSAIYALVDGEQKDAVKVNTGAEVAVQLDMNDASDIPVESVAENKVYIWVEDENGNAIRSVNFKSSDGKPVTDDRIKAYKNGYAFAPNNAEASKSYTVTIGTAGTYTIKAGYDLNGNGTNVLEFAESVKATVSDKATKVEKITIDGQDNEGAVEYTAAANGIDSQKVEFTVSSVYADGTPGNPVVDQTITVENNNESKGLYVLDADGNVADEITTDGNSGEFYLKVMKGYDFENSYIYLKSGKYSYKLTVKYTPAAPDMTPETIEAVKGLEGFVDVDGDQNADLAKVAQFVIKNEAGDELASPLTTTEPAVEGNNEKYITVKAQPEDAELSGKDFKLAYVNVDTDTQVWALQLADDTELVEGDYTVEVALLSGAKAKVSFTVAEFGTVEKLEIDGADTIKYTKDSTTTAYTVYAVDEKGMKKALTRSTDYVIGAIGDNANLVQVINGQIKMVAETDVDNIGKTIELYVIGQGDYKLTASKNVTIADTAVASTFAFDSENGEANKSNTVEVSLVDQNGDIVKTGTPATMTVQGYVVSSSNEDANVEVDFPITLKAGKADLTIFSDKATTLEIRVYGKDAGKLYANTLSYTIGAEELPSDANTTIAMTIGSNDFVVNNAIVNVPDAAPYIANSRTYVPFRALGEAIGADVVWDNDARTVTYTLDDTTIVMTIGESTYTVNGEEKTMDVAPEITNDRTYVPVRFVGEALGFKVTALSATDGTTAAVVFQK